MPAIGVDYATPSSEFIFENEALLEIAASTDKFGGRSQREEASAVEGKTVFSGRSVDNVNFPVAVTD